MADTEKSEQLQTNGLENGLDEDERMKLRPADIDADVKEMERRKRVEMIMSSKLFREELERIIELQLKDGNGPAGLLQQISDMMGIQSGKLHTTHMFRGSNCVTPINDIRGVESMGYEKGEKNLRCKLASVFRLMDLYGWSQGINNQITARLNQDEEHFLVNPHGMLFNEITASSLVKVDMQGNIVEPGTTNFSVNTQGFLLHSAIHASRPDVNCIIHIKTSSVLAVSSLKCGLLPICQEALVIGEVSQHPFVSGIFESEEREKIIRNLGPHNKVLLLHNHGAVCCGATVEEAFYNVYNTVLACETQMKLMPIGVENLLLVSDETRKQVYDAAHRAPDAAASGDKKKFRVGEMEFEALIRMLDNAGFRTGYIYRHPLVKGELPKPKNDVEVPPAVSSLGYLIEQEELYKQGNWKKYVDGRNRLDRTKWLNSPNVYQKVEILETGTSDPKKITKWVDQNSEEWVAESSPTHSSTPVKIDSALQFVPKGTNPKEFKKLQQQIKENRRAEKITSGPQSHILEGVSWEEAKKLQDANITQTGDQVILVGAASKGIIQRNYQHNALVYKTPYAKNPFDSMSDKEIEDYKQLVERKQRGDTDYEESQSESEAISSSRQDALRHFKSPLLSPQSATSETEEESRDEPRVLRIETKTAPRPIQAEVVLSDAESDTTDARVERSHSARYPKAEKPESVTLMNSFRKSWSLKREKDKIKDVENIYDSRNLHPNLILKECERDRMESLHCGVARLKQLTHRSVIVDVDSKVFRPLLKSASDPCNLSTLNDENTTEVDSRQLGAFKDANASFLGTNIVNTSDLQHRLNVRKKLLHSAKMKFLGYHKNVSDREYEVKSKTPTSPICALISEIRETISEIMSPERSKTSEDSDNRFNSLKWTERPKFMSRSSESNVYSKKRFESIKSKVSLSKSFDSLTLYDEPVRSDSKICAESKSDSEILNSDPESSEHLDALNFNFAIPKGNLSEKTVVEEDSNVRPEYYENHNEEKSTENVVTEAVKFINGSDEEATYTIGNDSLLQTYSFTETTETEWYYNKTIMKLENSQTILEIKENENKERNLEMPVVKYVDTGIDTDFTSERENEIKTSDPPVENHKEVEKLETTEDLEGEVPIFENSGLNKSSETDSSFLKSSSGRTSNDVDTSFAFKTETENSEKSPEKSAHLKRSSEEKSKVLEQMLLKTKEPCEEESSDSGEANVSEVPKEACKKNQSDLGHSKLSDIPESPEFTNIDTEDAPVTSSSKDTSPETADNAAHLTENEPVDGTKEPEVNFEEEEEKENLKPEHKHKKNVKSSTKITVKKKLKEVDKNDPVFSEIKLTIKNLNKCQSEKYEVKIQDVTNTSEDLSRSVSSAGENVDSYESLEIVENNCDCDAQKNLEELQGEVSSTIEKLHVIEDYFEDEIKKHSNVGSEKTRNGSDEFTIEYNYREFEEVLNESKGKMAALEIDSELSERTGKDFFDDVFKTEKSDNEIAEFFVLGDICGEFEVCNNPVGVDIVTTDVYQEYQTDKLLTGKSLPPVEEDIKDIAVSSAFVAALLSETLLESENLKAGFQKAVVQEISTTNKPESDKVVQVICSVEKLSDDAVPEMFDEKNEQPDIQKEMAEVIADVIEGLNLEKTTESAVLKLEMPCEEKLEAEREFEERQDVNLKAGSNKEDKEHSDHEWSEENDDLKQQFLGENLKSDERTFHTLSDDRKMKSAAGLEGSIKCEQNQDFQLQNGLFKDLVERNEEEPKKDKVQDCQQFTEGSNGSDEIQNFHQTETLDCPEEKDESGCQTGAFDAEIINETTAANKNDLSRPSEDVESAEPTEAARFVDNFENPEPACRQQLKKEDSSKDQQPSEEITNFKYHNSCEVTKTINTFDETPKTEVKLLELAEFLQPALLKAIYFQALEPQGNIQEKHLNCEPIEYILNCLLNSATEKNRKNASSVNDVINFLATNEESPTDSLAEFEDIENMISTSSSVMADIIDSIESRMEEEAESLPDEEEAKDTDAVKVGKRKRNKGDSMFKVTIATPNKKEIFINYSLDYSSTFNTSTDSCALEELCNSYIKTDDVNEDFENLSSDNPDFFSVGSPEKNSLNGSFSSAEGHVTAEQFCCAGCESNIMKSLGSLGIIQEVDEDDSSTSLEVAASSHAN